MSEIKSSCRDQTTENQEMRHDDHQLTNNLSVADEDTMESLTDNTTVGPPSHEALAGVVNLGFDTNSDAAQKAAAAAKNNSDVQKSSQERCNNDEPHPNHRQPAVRKAPPYNAQKSLEEEKNAVNQQQNGKILNHHQIHIPEDAVINYDTGRLRKSVHRGDGKGSGDLVALDVFADSAKAQEALMCVQANGGGDSLPQAVPVSSPLTSGDNGTKMFEEYFIPVNTHKKFLRGEKLYLTKEKRKVCSGWKRMFFCCLLLVILGIAVLVGVLAATGFLLSESKSSPKSVRVDPGSPSMSPSTSTLRGVPQPKEAVPQQPLPPLPPASPTIIVPPYMDRRPPITITTPTDRYTTLPTTARVVVATSTTTTSSSSPPPAMGLSTSGTTPEEAVTETMVPTEGEQRSTMSSSSPPAASAESPGVFVPVITTESPTTDSPTTESETTKSPTTESPTTELPTTESPTTELPTTELPTTELPTTELPTTELPTTGSPTTGSPITEFPTTESPTTESPTTELPTTELPTTELPTTELQTTKLPTTQPPTTELPITESPTVESPIMSPLFNESQTTNSPTTKSPSTELAATKPLTAELPATEPPPIEPYTTQPPSTESPTTEFPTTESSVTEPPTTKPPTIVPLTTSLAVNSMTTEPPTTVSETTQPTTTSPRTVTTNGFETADNPEGRFSMGPSFKVPNAVLGEITLPDETFQDSLDNKSSSEARHLTTKLKQGIEEILRENGYRYETVDILKFRRGSVVASFVVVSGDQYLPAHKVQDAIRAFLARNGGTLQGKFVDSNSVKAKDATNECKLDNGDCVGSACEWDYLTASKICHCSAGTSRYNATLCLPQPLDQTTVVQPTEGAKEGLETTTMFSATSAVPVTEVMTSSENPTELANPGATVMEGGSPTTPTRIAHATPVTPAGSDTTLAAYVTEPFTTSPYLARNVTDAVSTTSATESVTSTTQQAAARVVPPLVLDTAAETTVASENGAETMVATVSDGALGKEISGSAITSTAGAPPTTVAFIPITTHTPKVTAATAATVDDDIQTTVTSRSPVDASSFTPMFGKPKGDNHPNETDENFTTATDVTLPFTGMAPSVEKTTRLLDFLTTTTPAVTLGPSSTESSQASRETFAVTVPPTTVTTGPGLVTKRPTETAMTQSTTNDTEGLGTVPPIIVYFSENLTTIAPLTETTTATSASANTADDHNSANTVTTETSSSFLDLDEELHNGTGSELDFNVTTSSLQNFTVSGDTNITTVIDVAESPTAGNDTFEVTTVYPDGNTTASSNMTDGITITADSHNMTVNTLNATLDRSPVGNSSLEEMDPEVNVSNRTYAMGRNLTFMNNNTLPKDGADVINGTMDSWNMTANGTLLNLANFTLLDDGEMMATESANTSLSGTTTMMDFLNETIANSTEDVFRDLCSAEEFFCSAETSQTCLKKDFLCDQFEDCPGAIDEQNCTTSCGKNFQCNDSSCVIASAKCDGIRDCPDGEDEESCEILDSTCTDLEVMCPDSSACIKPLSFCDGIYDCRDRSDEIGCVDKTLCEQSDKFYCGDKLCIPSALRCDGHQDCKDGEDEVNCTCDDSQLQCMNGYCVSKSAGPVRCNGVVDCSDGSDERGCVKVDSNGVVHVFDGALSAWVLMCGDNSSLHDGHGVCQEMGYSHATSMHTARVDANTTSWTAWSSMGAEDDVWTKGLYTTDGCNNGALAVKCNHFECENQTEVLFRIERETTDKSSHSEVWPYLALIYGEGSQVACHAEIVSPLWLLTTAYCLQQLPQNMSLLYAQAGFAKVSNSSERHLVRSVVLHPHFSQFRSKVLPDFDLALVRLKNPLAFASHTAAACLPDDVVRPGVTCFVGSFGDGKPRVPFVKSTTIIHLPVVINELATCNNGEHYKEDVSQKMICGDGRKMKRQLCHSDLGAPLMCLSPNNIWRLAGILSYQRHCGTYRKHPSVFSNIFEMRDFIENVTGLKSYNVSHDPLLYTLSEFPQGDDAINMSEVRSYGSGNGTSFEHNTSAIAATLYLHEDLFGANGTNGTGAESPFGLLDLASDHNLTDVVTIESTTEGKDATTTTSPLEGSAEAKFREVDLSEVTTVFRAIEVTTIRVPEDGVATFSRLVDGRDVMDNDTGSGNKTGRAEVESGEESFVTTDIVSDNATLSFHEQNDAEDTTTTSPVLALTTEEFIRGTATTSQRQQQTTTTTRSISVATSAENYTHTPTAVSNETSTFSSTLTIEGLGTTTILGQATLQAGGILQNSSNVETTTALVQVTTMSTPKTTENRTLNAVGIATTIASLMPTERTDSLNMIVDFRENCTGFRCIHDNICINKSFVCNGNYDCADASDEIGCVKLEDGEVQARVRGKNYVPLCGETWDDSLSDLVCQELGYSKASWTTIIALDLPHNVSLMHTGKSFDRGQNLGLLKMLRQKTGMCTTKVTVQCHQLQCGSWNFTHENSSKLNATRSKQMHWPSVGLLKSEGAQCVTSILSPYWLLTSWSCMSNSGHSSNISSWTFIVEGREPGQTNSSVSVKYSVSAIMPYPTPESSTAADVALVRTGSPLELGDGLKTICLSEKKAKVQQHCATVGRTKSESGCEDQLSYVPVILLSHSNGSVAGELGDGVTCASLATKEGMLCQGGAGAPLMCTSENGRWELYGVFSNTTRQGCSSVGAGDDAALLSSSYSNTHSAVEWIRSVVRP